MKMWLDVKQAAGHVGLSRDTIYTACERGELKHVRVSGRRTIRLRAEWLDEWLELYAVPAQAPSQTERGGSGVWQGVQ